MFLKIETELNSVSKIATELNSVSIFTHNNLIFILYNEIFK